MELVIHYIYLTNMVFVPYDIALVREGMTKIKLYNSSHFNKYIWNEYYYIVTSKIKNSNLPKDKYEEIQNKAKIIYSGYRQLIVILFYYLRIRNIVSTRELEMITKGIIIKIRKLPDIDTGTLSLCNDLKDIKEPKELESSLFNQLNYIFKKIHDDTF